MSLLNSLRTSISGMNAQSRKLDTIADNIGNSSTVGYKRADTQFSTLVTDARARSYSSGGVDAIARFDINSQGVIQATSNATDIAIRGNGFFYVEGADGTRGLTRAGSFLPDRNGDLQNIAGYYLMGFPVDGTAASNTNINDVTRVNLNQFRLIANPTTEGAFVANLPSDAPIITANLPSSNGTTAQFSAKSSLVVYDNLGQKVVLDMYLTKTAANQWEMTVYNAADATNSGFPYTSGPIDTQSLAFNAATGAITGPISMSLTIPNGAAMTIDLSSMTQLAADYQVLSAQTNGNAPSTIDRVEINENGTLSVLYQDGTRRAIYKIPLASVPSNHNLIPTDGNVFLEGSESGAITLGDPNSSNLGSIISNSLESSNVDLGTELTMMIETQRAYTANSKTFKTSSEMLEILMSIRS